MSHEIKPGIRESSRIVNVDMNGVLADFRQQADMTLLEHIPGAQLVPQEKLLYHRYAENYPPNYKNVIDDFVHTPGFFENVPVIDGAINGLARIIKADFIPRIVTNYPTRHMSVAVEKRKWVEKHLVPHFGRIILDTMQLSGEKWRFDGCLLLDDKPEVDGHETAMWQHAVMNHAYNQASPAAYRLNGLDDVELESVLEKAHTNYLQKRPSGLVLLPPERLDTDDQHNDRPNSDDQQFAAK